MERHEKQIFKKGSKTYFNSSIFFPKKARDDIATLYAFVRTADDLVDSKPAKRKEFLEFRREYELARAGRKSSNKIITRFLSLSERKCFNDSWADAFLDSMQADLDVKGYATIKDTLWYIYGSAEVIGIYMNRILDIQKEADKHARYLGRAMQYINFIRDIKEDNELGRNYFPKSEMRKYGLTDLSFNNAMKNKKKFEKFIRAQIGIYIAWQHEAEKGFKYIPKRILIPIKTASDMYKWTAEQIRRNPMIVYERKVKPKKGKIIFTAIKNSIRGK